MNTMLREADIDAVGELLRSVTFPGEGTGCYSNFDVREGAHSWDTAQLRNFWTIVWGEPAADDWLADTVADILDLAPVGYTYELDGVRVEVSWFWDGDGTLAFRVWSGEQLIRAALNTDAKKNYRWQDVTGGPAKS